jgi:hypothetical protein
MTLPNEFTVYGSEEMLKPLILQLLAQHYDQGGEATGGGGTYQRLPSSVVGQCFIKLRFYGRSQTGAQHFVYKSFRWVKANPQTVTQEAITTLANAIKTKFDNLKFTTGHKAFTYNRPDQGFNRVWGFFKDQTEAMRVFEQMLDLQGFSPDWSRLTESSVVQAGDRFQSPAEKIQQAGVLIRTQEERPVATVGFNGAFIKFPHIPDEGFLVDFRGNIMNVAKFLASYKD